MITLINPYISSMERYGKNIGDIGGHQMPLGIFYLASYLRKDGISSMVIDAEARNLVHEEVIEELISNKSEIVGITSTTVAFKNARSLAKTIRAELPDVKIIVGGPHMSAMPEATMKTGDFDYGIIKEGEIPFSLLCKFLLSDEGSLDDIPNLYYFKDNELVKSAKTVVIEDMDSIPFPARDLCPDYNVYTPPVGAYKQRPVMNIITSRGCPYQCIFCDNNTFGRKTRFFSAEYVFNEIKEVITKYHAREIAFLDDTFVIDKERLYRIFELLNNEGIHFSWTCMTRVNNITFDLLKFMKDNGCWQIRFGIESGSQEVLDFIKKGITLEQVRKATQWCKELNIMTTGFLMFGHHIDTEKTLEETVAFALSLPLTDVVATINTPIPGTESYRLARQYGTYDEKDWCSLNYWTPVFVPKNLTREKLIQKQAELYKKFYMRPRVILNQLKKIRSMSAVRMLIKNAILGLKFTLNRKNA
ncbi:MAG: radical SAM protein [Victivallaceae bacterium]|nr:radical SAM protein [Victivallaceae bacterium]